MGQVTNLLDRAVYSFAQIDRVLGLRSGTASRWIDGYTRRGKDYPPVVRVERTGNNIATWGELVECRLLSEFRDSGVPIRHLRPAVERLRSRVTEVSGTPSESDIRYPLASAKLWLHPEGRELLMNVQEEVDLQPGLQFVVRTGQYTLPIWTEPVERFKQSIRWSSELHDAIPLVIWLDDDRIIEVDPERGFGDPVIAGRGIQTSVVAELHAAGESVRQIADEYDLTEREVEAALAHENEPVSA